MIIKEFKSFKRKTAKFKIKDQLLFRKISKNVLLQRVVHSEDY